LFHDAIEVLPIAARCAFFHAQAKQWERHGSTQRPSDQAVHADMFALGLSEHGLMHIVGNGGSKRGHGCVIDRARTCRRVEGAEIPAAKIAGKVWAIFAQKMVAGSQSNENHLLQRCVREMAFPFAAAAAGAQIVARADPIALGKRCCRWFPV
jgi:hypothetical protein